MALVGAILAFLWPVVQNGIGVLSELVRNAGAIGTFFYGVIERALIPFGLHHVFYTPFWYGSFVEGQILVDGKFVGYLGAIHPKYQKEHSLNETYVFELNFDLTHKCLLSWP